jgi:hypothetical protein
MNKSKIGGSKHPFWKGYEDISATYFDEIISKAKKRNLEFNITLKDIWDLYILQDKKCALTHRPIHFITRRKRDINNEQTASLDRIDSNKDYIEGNLQWIHKDINLMKNKLDQNRFLQLCEAIAKNN